MPAGGRPGLQDRMLSHRRVGRGHLKSQKPNRKAMPLTSMKAPVQSTAPAGTHRAALTVMTTLFFMWGFVTVLNDVLVAHLKSIFDLDYTRALLVQFAFFSTYFI